jgi:2-keto-4-pentenoate hydratase/2-oxohepta-3-ene-1,7-dioic acid hydratase in catechol pathway
LPQWTRAKGFDGCGVIGPPIETDSDPAVASVRRFVGGRERQNCPLTGMIFPPHELVARLSQDMTLEPGDVILRGTSKLGMTVVVENEGIGRFVDTRAERFQTSGCTARRPRCAARVAASKLAVA